jgi:serine protease Do
MSILDDLGSAVRQLAGSIGGSVVGIGRHTRGSGVVIADGQVLTNAHNLRGDEVTVTFADGRRAVGTVAGVDGDGDLAVIAVDTAGASPIAWGSGEELAVGTPVFGAAATVGGGTRVTFGLVSAVSRAFRGPGGRRIAGSVEHTAPLAPGSSGGALLDAGGHLVGLNTNRIGEGFYLALPADPTLRERVDALGRGESPSRLRLGVAIAPNHVARRLRRSVGLAERDGVLVRGVEAGSLADAAGIEAGDLIVSAAGRAVGDGDDLFDALGRASTPFEVGLVRGAEEKTVTVGAPTGRTPGDA